jgi:hypothetical protein
MTDEYMATQLAKTILATFPESPDLHENIIRNYRPVSPVSTADRQVKE